VIRAGAILPLAVSIDVELARLGPALHIARFMKTVLEVIQATTAYFEKHEIESPRLNIEHLLAHLLGLRRMDLYMQFDRPLSTRELEPLREMVRRRSLGEPLQHLLGNVEFLGRTFLCDKRALIPRPETEQLCEKLITRAKDSPFRGRLLDIGTGSGVIALSLAAAWPEAEVEGVDISESALELASENAHRLGVAARARFFRSDLLAAAEGEYQLMVANLPYVAAEELGHLAREVKHDPVGALVGGVRGTELISRLIAGARSHLRGELALEIGHTQARAICAELQDQNYHDIRMEADYQGHDRFVFAQYG
jgi:release factor glutamine methyltransferase